MDHLVSGSVVTEDLWVRVGHGSTDESAGAAPDTRSAAAATALLGILRGHTKHGVALAQQSPIRPQEVGEEVHQTTDDASPQLPPSPPWCVVTLCHRARPYVQLRDRFVTILSLTPRMHAGRARRAWTWVGLRMVATYHLSR
jgi:hypothetical protein